MESLEEKVKTEESKNKRKRWYSEITSLKKAIIEPEIYLVDPILEAEKAAWDAKRKKDKKLKGKKERIESEK